MVLAIRMSPEVEAALGPQMAQQVRGITEAPCIECQSPLVSGPVNVVFGRSTVATAGSIWLAHDHCAPSRIVPLNAEATAAVIQPEDELGMTMATDIIDGTPVLVARMVMTPLTYSGTHFSEPRNLLMQHLLQSGFHLITTTELDAPPLAKWIAVVLPHERDWRLLVVEPSGGCFYDGAAMLRPEWIELVLGAGQVLLLAGDVGGRHDDEAGQLRASLAVAVRNGQLAGARIACGRPAAFGVH